MNARDLIEDFAGMGVDKDKLAHRPRWIGDFNAIGEMIQAIDPLHQPGTEDEQIAADAAEVDRVKIVILLGDDGGYGRLNCSVG